MKTKSTFAEIAQSRNREFRPRGNEPMRLENFSDACFGMAITVLLISTSPPTSFEQVRRFVWEIIPFALCLGFIVLVWYEHFLFFYRYALFLVIVLFYVYPFKFLATLMLILISMLVGAKELQSTVMSMIKLVNGIYTIAVSCFRNHLQESIVLSRSNPRLHIFSLRSSNVVERSKD